MLYDENFIKPGAIFPPACEIERLQDYKDNLGLFNGNSYDVFKHYYKDANTRILRVLNDYQDIIGYPIDINYHRLTSVSISDLVQGETPTVKTDNNSDIEPMLNDIKLYSKLNQWVIDISRYGDAVARIYAPDDDKIKAQVAVYEPTSFFKVVDRGDKDNMLKAVLATVVEAADSTEDKPKWELLVEIHEKGFYIERVFELEPIPSKDITLPNKRIITNLQRYKIKKQKGQDNKVDTNLPDFAIVPMHQLVTSDDCYGKDDYASLDPILAEIWARLGQIAIILDKHSRPDVYAALSAFEQNAQGVWQLKVGGGNTYVLNQGDPIPGYMTWDGQLMACFNELTLLFEQLYKISEMGAIYEAATGKNNIAYETMKATFVRPLAKARRITKDITDPIKKIIWLTSVLYGTEIPEDDITIDWFDGLPNDEKQEIEKATMKINADLSTPEQENIDRFGYTEEQTQDIAEKVRQRNQEKQATMFGGFGSPTKEPLEFGDE